MATLLAAVANAVSPTGIAWTQRWGHDLRARVLAAGLRVVGREEVRASLADGAAVLVDARIPEQFHAGHLPGAISVPWLDAADVLDRHPLPRGRPIITYCGGDWCAAAMLVAEALRRRGHEDVAVFVGGLEEWRRDEGR